ncbi:hypothetical protein [uncultured Algimonas sp.]|uniref:hypothetical protein n=1 Tax=uncultured Algimonas sp. TaxID=1547920 RepID=UPI0026149772|nr:hypothetical protein [uncultured Algimonas sp.]
MFTLELAWFELDLPDQAQVKAEVAAPSPLFSNMRVGTVWRIGLGRFEMTAALDAVRGLHDLSREAFDAGNRATEFDAGGLPGLRVGGYDRDDSRTDWWFSLNGLTLALTLRATSAGAIVPTEAECRDHAAIIRSVRRVERND